MLVVKENLTSKKTRLYLEIQYKTFPFFLVKKYIGHIVLLFL